MSLIPENPLDLFGQGKTIVNFFVQLAEQKYAQDLEQAQVTAAQIDGTRIELQKGKFIIIKVAEQSKSEEISHLYFSAKLGTFKVTYQGQEYNFSNLPNNALIYFSSNGAKEYLNEACIPPVTPEIENTGLRLDAMGADSSTPEDPEQKVAGADSEHHDEQ
jgi:hypothetical protein